MAELSSVEKDLAVFGIFLSGVFFYANQICNQRTKNALWHDSDGSCSDGLSLRPQRPAAEQKELANKWNEMGTDEPGLQTSPIAVYLLWFSTVDLYVCVRVCERDALAYLQTGSTTPVCVFELQSITWRFSEDLGCCKMFCCSCNSGWNARIIVNCWVSPVEEMIVWAQF